MESMTWKKFTIKEIDEMEQEAIQTLLSKGYSIQEIDLMKTNIHAMIAPIIRFQFKKFYDEKML